MSAPSQELLDRAQAGDATAQFELGYAYANTGALTRARRWFEKAAQQGHDGARIELALHLLYGMHTDGDPQRACRELQQLANQGSASAAYQVAVLRAGGVLLAFDLHSFALELGQAARGGIPAAQRALALIAASADKADEAQALLYELAKRDPLAQSLHTQDASVTKAYSFDSLLAAVESLERSVPGRQIRAAPLLECIPDLLSPVEQRYLRLLAESRLQPAKIIDPLTGRAQQLSYRSNSVATLGPELNDLALVLIERKLVRAAGGELVHAEPVSVLRYRAGEEYRPHRDYFDPRVQPQLFTPSQPGQRLRTVFCCLGEVEAGGETDFPRWGERIPARAGQAVVFDNVDQHGQPAPDSLHAGLPVTAGEKWLATIWLRERAVRAW